MLSCVPNFTPCIVPFRTESSSQNQNIGYMYIILFLLFLTRIWKHVSLCHFNSKFLINYSLESPLYTRQYEVVIFVNWITIIPLVIEASHSLWDLSCVLGQINLHHLIAKFGCRWNARNCSTEICLNWTTQLPTRFYLDAQPLKR